MPWVGMVQQRSSRGRRRLRGDLLPTVSCDTRAKVKPGPFAAGGSNRAAGFLYKLEITDVEHLHTDPAMRKRNHRIVLR